MEGRTPEQRRRIRMEKLKEQTRKNDNNDKDNQEPITPVVKSKSKDKKLRYIRCVSCKLVPFPTQLSLCKQGHIVCISCAAINVRCPGMSYFHGENRCRQMINPVVTPTTLHESIYKEALWRCPYFRDGCSENLPGSIIVSHAQCCEYRPGYPCPVPNCGARTDSAVTLNIHLRKSHEVASTLASMKTFHVSYNQNNCASEAARGKRFPQLLEISGMYFLVVVEEQKQEVKIWVWHFSDNVNNSVGFRYKLIIHGKLTSTFHLEWTGESVELPNRTSQMIGHFNRKTCYIIQRKNLEVNCLKHHKQILYWTAGVVINKEDIDKNQFQRSIIKSTAGNDIVIPETTSEVINRELKTGVGNYDVNEEASTNISKSDQTQSQDAEDLTVSFTNEDFDEISSDDSIITVVAANSDGNSNDFTPMYLKELHKQYLKYAEEEKLRNNEFLKVEDRSF